MSQITYTRNGDYLLPDIRLKIEPYAGTTSNCPPLGVYARIRRAFLKEHRPILYSQLLLSEQLYPHLWEIDEAAAHRLAVIPNRAQAEEMINELIYE